MFRDLAEPGDAARFELDVWIETACNGAVDDRLLLLVEQRDELPLGSNRMFDLAVRVAEKPRDGSLLVRGRDRHPDVIEIICIKSPKPFDDPFCAQPQFFSAIRRPVKRAEVAMAQWTDGT